MDSSKWCRASASGTTPSAEPGDVWGQISVGVDGTIFPVLAPVLRPGRPLPEVPGDPPFYVSRRDAAEMQG
nr:hypothetical protein GCM10020092_017320 [Actinoplanes digitatis]